MFGENFLRLRQFNRLFQNHFSNLELACLGIRLRFLADVALFGVKNISTALRTFADRFFVREINLRQRLARHARLALAFFLARRKFKRRLAIFQYEERLELPVVFLGDKTLEQIRLARREQLLDLRRLDGLLQNDFAAAERAGLFRRGLLLADVVHARIIDIAAARRTFAERFLAREINRRARLAVLVLVVAEIELRLEFRVHLNNGCERKTLLAAKTLQRPDDALGDEFLDFKNFQLPARHDFPKREIAFLALEFFVVLVDLAAAFRAGHSELAVIAGHGVALVTLRLRHHVARRVGDFTHEIIALHFAARHEV